MNGNLTVFDDWTSLGTHLALRARTILDNAIAQRGRAVLALSGGRTPNHYLPSLRAQPLPWDRTIVTLIDERFVPVDHPQSNEGLARRHGFDPCHGLRGTAPAPERAASEASEQLAAIALPWDMAIYGLGEDGHIASLFPGLPLSADAPLCLATRAPDGSDRLSMSPTALTRFGHPLLVIGGASKRRVLDRAEAEDLPVRLLLAQPTLEILHCTADG
jgi:6-phosphogluconolactonase